MSGRRSEEEANKAAPLSLSQTPCDTLNPPPNKVCQYNSLGSQLLTAEPFFTVTLPDPQRARYWKGELLSLPALLYLLVFPDMEMTWHWPASRAGYFERGGLFLHPFFSLLVSFRHEACQPNQYGILWGRRMKQTVVILGARFVFAALLTKRFGFESFSLPERPESLITEVQPWPSAFNIVLPQTGKLKVFSSSLSYISGIMQFWLKFGPCTQWEMKLMQTRCKNSLFLKANYLSIELSRDC